MTEHVIYALDDRYDPAVQYYSLPTSCVGGGASLHAARASYRNALADTLGVDRRHLPEIVEHVETPVVGDIWVRSTVDSRNLERDRVVVLVREAMKVVDDVTRKELDEVVTASGLSVLVVMLNDEPMGAMLDQMSIHDALWMAFPRVSGLAWTALYRPQAEGLQASQNWELDAEEVRGMTVAEFVRDIVEVHNEGHDIEIDEHGHAHRTPRAANSKPRSALVLTS